ncbi:Efflux pump periplasmic linker BepF [Halomonadaceae bacterium LMG 33818]|uniref:efflux RND transporter periplasmic adaptor subunit n=1 Tax=Cernens ardua TaxID=3402176 RepID=UPI003EDB8E5B
MLQINKSKRVLWGLAGVVALATAGCSHGNDSQPQAQQQAQAKPAPVFQISPQNIELNKSYPSMVRSDNAAAVTARVQGFLESQVYTPGQIVKKGAPLFTIERSTYAAAVNQAKANLVQAQANQVTARRNFHRYNVLYHQGVISAYTLDSYQNALDTSSATVQEAQAALNSAQINLDYTTVRAPADGQVSLNKINVGNLVSSGTELATVTPVNPLEVRFQLPQEDAMQARQQEHMNGAPQIGVELDMGTGDSQTTLQGRLDFIGDNVNTDTNTVQARAVFDNSKGVFLPGQYADVKLTHLLRFNAFAVPEISVTQGLMGPQVYVLDGQNRIASRTVQLGDLSGDWQIITSGLNRGDRVVAGDTGGLTVGETIDPQPFNGNPNVISADQGNSGQGNGNDQSSNGQSNSDQSSND